MRAERRCVILRVGHQEVILSGRRGGSEEHFVPLERSWDGLIAFLLTNLLLKHVQEVGQQVQKGVPTLRISIHNRR